jgi:UDP-GlcNAc:undecaprenyl-phosphate GlcNAc-1-phosphate transferase
MRQIMTGNNGILGELLNSNIEIVSIALFAAALICVNLLIPIVIWVSLQKRLVTPVNNRSSHSSIAPPFGGVAFYIIFIVFISVIQLALHETTGYSIIASISILFMIGLKDDLVHSSARIKLIAQLFASILTVGSEKFSLTAEMGSEQVFVDLLQTAVTLLLLVFIINAYNLIDGIDGLAASTGMISCSGYALLFYHYDDHFFLLLSIITVGILVAFMKFNVSGSNRKIFMGDCGSLTIGLILGLCTLRFLAITPPEMAVHHFSLEYKLVMIAAILFIPLFDTCRIIFIRLKKGQHLFRADKNHIHHVLLRRGLSHAKASLLLSTIHLIVAAAVLILAKYASITALCLILTIVSGASVLFFDKNRFKNQYTGS